MQIDRINQHQVVTYVFYCHFRSESEYPLPRIDHQMEGAEAKLCMIYIGYK